MPLAKDQHLIQALRRNVPTNRSANALARGDRTGILITRVPVPAKTSSNAAVNLLSRSRTCSTSWQSTRTSRPRSCHPMTGKTPPPTRPTTRSEFWEADSQRLSPSSEPTASRPFSR